jgi:hypothetical protein
MIVAIALYLLGCVGVSSLHSACENVDKDLATNPFLEQTYRSLISEGLRKSFQTVTEKSQFPSNPT